MADLLMNSYQVMKRCGKYTNSGDLLSRWQRSDPAQSGYKLNKNKLQTANGA
jgi:hypothetical protein